MIKSGSKKSAWALKRKDFVKVLVNIYVCITSASSFHEQCDVFRGVIKGGGKIGNDLSCFSGHVVN